MKLNKRIVRVGLVIAATAAVSYPLLNQLRTNPAQAQGGEAAAPAGGHGPALPPPLVVTPAPRTAFPTTDPSTVVLTIGPDKITAGQFNQFFSDLDPSFQARILAHPEAKHQLAEKLVDMGLLAGEARRQKLDDSLRVKTTYQQALSQALVVSLAKETAANQKFFDDNKDYFTNLQARHILIAVAGGGVDTATLTGPQAKAKAKAESIKARLDKGEDFAAVARAESDDKHSGAEGGNLGTMSRAGDQRMVPEFEEAAFALKEKEISQPVKTEFGYHIIQVLTRRIPKYDEVAEAVPGRRMELLLAELKKAQKTVINEAYFGVVPTTQPAATQPTTAPAAAPTTGPVRVAPVTPAPAAK